MQESGPMLAVLSFSVSTTIIYLFLVDGLRSAFLAMLQAVLETFDHDDPLRPQHVRTANGELTHGSASPDRDRISGSMLQFSAPI